LQLRTRFLHHPSLLSAKKSQKQAVLRGGEENFSKAEKELMEDGYKRAAEAVEMIVMGDIDTAMNQFNKKVVREE